MTHPDKAMVERVELDLIDNEAKALAIIDTAFGEAGCKRPFFGEAYEPGTVVASIYLQVAALTAGWMPIETVQIVRHALQMAKAISSPYSDTGKAVRKALAALPPPPVQEKE